MRLTREEYTIISDAIREYVAVTFDLTMGSVATDQFIQFLEEDIVGIYEDHAIEKVRTLVEEKAWSMDEDIRALKAVKRK